MPLLGVRALPRPCCFWCFWCIVLTRNRRRSSDGGSNNCVPACGSAETFAAASSSGIWGGCCNVDHRCCARQFDWCSAEQVGHCWTGNHFFRGVGRHRAACPIARRAYGALVQCQARGARKYPRVLGIRCRAGGTGRTVRSSFTTWTAYAGVGM